jgi:hypothetical protein
LGLALGFGLEKILEAGEFDNKLPRQYGVDYLSLRRSMYLVQMLLCYWFGHEPVDAFSQSPIEYQIRTGAVRGTNRLVVARRPFSESRRSGQIDFDFFLHT